MQMPAGSLEVRFPVLEDNFSEYADTVLDKLTKACEDGTLGNTRLDLPNYEGVRICFDDEDKNGWILLRKSLHDPIMPLNIESSVEGGCDKIIGVIKPVLKEFTGLDTAKL